MRSPARRFEPVIAVLLALAASSSCAVISATGLPPSLFPAEDNVKNIDFENGALHASPEGFEARLGQWFVADSPTAASGTQVLVRGGGGAGELVLKDATGATAAGGEVAVRVFLGAPGAGLWCDADRGQGGYLLKLEPDSRRIALYRTSTGSMTAVDQADADVPKGEWRRLGIRCQSDGVIGYLDGQPLVKNQGPMPPFDLALYADPGVTAQFDDFKYWVLR
jgi:hypothetical protein